MKSPDFERSIRGDSRTDRLSPATIAEWARCAAIVHAAHPFDFERHSIELLREHAIKAGRRRNRGPSPYKLAIARAAIWARWNKGIGKDEAASLAAKANGVPSQAVYRAAFERKDAEMNAIIRELMSTPEKYNQG